MSESPTQESDFLNRVAALVKDHISDESFGVSELSSEMGMSRSNLLRRIKKLTQLSVSQYIRQLRLQHGLEMMRETSLTVSEVSFKVGFSSPSYFIKCFREYYGYPPGETEKSRVGSGDPVSAPTTSQSHQLAAIMFTDIQGYTALMQQDEDKAVAFRSRHREVFNAVTKNFNGKILQYYGDGTLSTFNSAIDAVRCGIGLQKDFREETPIPVRIGIHSGDIIFTEDDIIGDGVNVASRIESLAVPGSVLISEKVYDEVKNQSGIQTESMGVFELKNVGKPMEVFAISNPGLTIPQRDVMTGKLKSDPIQSKNGSGEKRKWRGIAWLLLALLPLLVGYIIYTSGIFEKRASTETSSEQIVAKKSIAVLPFINDSNDSTNVYIINGLMESILDNLQKIEDLRVVSRTSVEKFRNTTKTIPEIAKELNVDYFVEGSGQKIGDQILLHIQLIEASSDEHLWSEQYNRQARDIFSLQLEVAKNIAGKIEVIITPAEEARINKKPTENLLAYDHFLKGLDLFYKGNRESVEESISWFEKAIAEDGKFARAYADIAMAYYVLDAQQAEKVYSVQINDYADKALLLDAKLPQSLMAKAFFFINIGQKEQAIPYLEKALEYNPNSALVINILSDFYTSHVPNTAKYLEYALQGIQLDIASHDSATASFIYLHVSNAFIQSGFIDEAEYYIAKSLEYNPLNIFSAYVRAYILFARDRDLQQTKGRLIETLAMDSNRYDVIQEVGKICYYMRDYESSYAYYKRFIEIRDALNLDVYGSENAKIGVVLEKVGLTEESEAIFKEYLEYAENDASIYKPMSLAVYYAHRGDTKKAIEHLKLFSQEDNYHYWTILFLEMDPLIDNIKDLPEFKEILKDIEDKFWSTHKRIRASLEEKKLI